MSFDTSIHYVTYDHNQDRGHFPHPQKFSHDPSQSILSPLSSQATIDLHSVMNLFSRISFKQTYYTLVSTQLQVSVAHSFLLLNTTPLNTYNTICLYFYLLMDISVVSNLNYCNRMPMSICVQVFERHMLLFLLGKYLVIELLSYMVSIC